MISTVSSPPVVTKKRLRSLFGSDSSLDDDISILSKKDKHNKDYGKVNNTSSENTTSDLLLDKDIHERLNVLTTGKNASDHYNKSKKRAMKLVEKGR